MFSLPFFSRVVVPLLVLAAGVQAEVRCERGPGDRVYGQRSKPDDKFRIFINGEYDVYNPGEMYTVTLKSDGPWFVWFSLWAEAGRGISGTLHPFGDYATKSLESCPALVTAASSVPRHEAASLWSAPAPGSGCVTFKAAVVVTRDLWYQEEGPLTYTICENLSQSFDEQPQVNQECCACYEAKYEVGFEGLWSRQTHPKDFPDKNVTRFSDVIGASHTTDYRFWDYGGIASEGLREVAELGSTRTLESELKSQSQHIRTIIKARGIAFPNVTSKTFAVFRVDSKHHLISLVSMMAPSPDWIVGVSGLELCLSNCSWVESKVLNLYPWDAGTDSGLTYLSPKNRTEPKDHIRRITSSFPSDPHSPFFDPSGEPMKPLAKLYLTRQRLYEKVCETNSETETVEAACESREWGEWSPCSVTCGVGSRTRQRFYKNEKKAFDAGCQEELTSRKPCHQPQPCRWDDLEETGEKYREMDRKCPFSPWSEWSSCSAQCGTGQRHRFRRLLEKRNWKECMYVSRPPATKQSESCPGEQGESCPQEAVAVAGNCSVRGWSEWSACSVSCGEGRRQRQRQLAGDGCSGLPAKEEIPCLDRPYCSFQPEEAKEICFLGKPEGPCRGQFEKYYFNAETGLCTKFVSGGCPLSKNQFDTFEDCEASCGFIRETQVNSSEQMGNLLTGGTTYDNPGNMFGEMRPASYLGTMEPVTGVEGPVVDCQTSQWNEWGQCSASCGQGYKKRIRYILQNARNGGRACPKKLLKTRKCHAGPCPGYMVAESSNLHEYEDDESRNRVDCVYTEWSPWTACNPPCGLNSLQQRTREVDRRRSSSGTLCSERMETRVCNVLPCAH